MKTKELPHALAARAATRGSFAITDGKVLDEMLQALASVEFGTGALALAWWLTITRPYICAAFSAYVLETFHCFT